MSHSVFVISAYGITGLIIAAMALTIQLKGRALRRHERNLFKDGPSDDSPADDNPADDGPSCDGPSCDGPSCDGLSGKP